MTHTFGSGLLHQLRALVTRGATALEEDAQLLQRFVRERDEPAFTALVQSNQARCMISFRHSGQVWKWVPVQQAMCSWHSLLSPHSQHTATTISACSNSD